MRATKHTNAEHYIEHNKTTNHNEYIWISQKFSHDSCFGLLKQKYIRTAVNTLQAIADVVTESAVCNNVEVVGWEDGV